MSPFQIPEIKTMTFEQMTFRYDGGAPVFENVDFKCPVNNFIWVKSAQMGAGRSTLLQIMAGLTPISSGKYLINDKNVADMTFEEFIPYRLTMGYSFDYGGLLSNKTLFDNLILPLLYHKLFSEEEAERRVNMYMQEMGILRYKDQRPSAVQGSVRKITCLLRPILSHPQVLLLDEPSLGLSQDLILKYFDLIQDLRRQGSAKHVFVSTFDEKLMGMIEHQELLIDRKQLFCEASGTESTLKKVGNL